MDSKRTFKSSSRKAEKFRSNKCLNCNHNLELTDIYCPSCSQLNSTKQLSIKDFFGEFLSSIFTYDSRLRYTLKDLLLKPGIISKNYVKGQRLKYANPFRFFLSVSITYFLLQGIVNTFVVTDKTPVVKNLTVNGETVGDIDPKLLEKTIDSINDTIFENGAKKSKPAIY